MIGIELMMACAPAVAPETIQQIIQVESRGDPLALNVNVKWVIERDENGQPIMVTSEDGSIKPKRRKVTFTPPIEVKNVQDAVTVAYAAIAAGHSVDMGYMQVNSNNLPALGYSVEDMFDGCKNLAAGARVLSEFYAQAKPKHDNEQAALRAALSAYNTGNFINGFTNGYVARYGISGPVPLVRVPAINPYTADTDVALNPRKEITMNDTKETVVPVVSQSADDAETPGVQVEYTADAAEQNGAFEETAMSEKEAWEANADLPADPESTGIVIGGQKVNRGGN